MAMLFIQWFVWIILLFCSVTIKESIASVSSTTTIARTITTTPTSNIAIDRRGENDNYLFNNNNAMNENGNTTTTTTTRMKSAIVVGGGPCGLATALILSQNHGYKNITILEMKQQHQQYDPSLAYSFGLKQHRGQAFLRHRLPNVFNDVIQHAASSDRLLSIVIAADPNIIFHPQRKQQEQEQQSQDHHHDQRRVIGKLLFLQRHLFVEILLRHISCDPNIRMEWGTKCNAITICKNNNDNDLLQVHATTTLKNDDNLIDATETTLIQQEKTYQASLIVGADGMHSTVRQLLATSTDNDFSKQMSKFNPNQFKVKQWSNPGSGVRLKTLQCNSDLTIPTGIDGKDFVYQLDKDNDNMRTYRIESMPLSKTTAPTTTIPHHDHQLDLYIFPIGTNYTTKVPISALLLPSHEIWNCKSGTSIQQWFEQAYPRINFTKFVDMEEWERFATSPGLSLPQSMWCPGMVVTSTNGQCGIVLLGDAIHTIPPMMGEGVNAALEDVSVLDDVLNLSAITNLSLGSALTRFQKLRRPQSKALVQISRTGIAPLIFGVGSVASIRRKLGFLHIKLRSTLHKWTNGIVPSTARLEMENPNYTYQQAWNRGCIGSKLLLSITCTLCSTLLLLMSQTLNSNEFQDLKSTGTAPNKEPVVVIPTTMLSGMLSAIASIFTKSNFKNNNHQRNETTKSLQSSCNDKEVNAVMNPTLLTATKITSISGGNSHTHHHLNNDCSFEKLKKGPALVAIVLLGCFIAVM